jgi:hypothetical protein
MLVDRECLWPVAENRSLFELKKQRVIELEFKHGSFLGTLIWSINSCPVFDFPDRGGSFGADGGVKVVGEGATKGVPDGLLIGEGEGHGFWVGWRRLN